MPAMTSRSVVSTRWLSAHFFAFPVDDQRSIPACAAAPRALRSQDRPPEHEAIVQSCRVFLKRFRKAQESSRDLDALDLAAGREAYRRRGSDNLAQRPTFVRYLHASSRPERFARCNIQKV